MAAYLSPIGNEQEPDSNGAPVSGALITTYLAGTTTPVATYTDAAGSVPQSNPIVCNSAGYPASPIYLPAGVAVKMVFTTSVASGSVAYRPPVDNITGVNDPSFATTVSEWTAFSGTPTFISTTSFSVTGDQTLTFQLERRIKSTNTGGTVYSTIKGSAFAAGITTITVVNTSGVLDSGLSSGSVSYGLLAATNSSIPAALPTTTSLLAGTTGAARNLRASLTANGASITFTADEVIVSVTLGGLSQRLASYSKTLATAGTGAGGMDTGAIPTSGFLAIYAIAKADGTQSILGVNATTSSGTIYSGANMPSGYTYSALIAVIPTSSAPAIVACLIQDRHHDFVPIAVVSGGTLGTTLTSQSLSVAVPAAAKTADLQFIAVTSGTIKYQSAGNANGIGIQATAGAQDASSRTSGGGMSSGYAACQHRKVPLITAQTAFVAGLGSGGQDSLYVTGYDI